MRISRLPFLDKIEQRTQQTVWEVTEERFEKRLAQVEAKIKRVRADLIQWMFIFWVGQVGTITAILFAFFKR